MMNNLLKEEEEEEITGQKTAIFIQALTMLVKLVMNLEMDSF